MKLKYFLILIIFFTTELFSQVLTWQPYFFSDTSTVTITYDASLGNGELKNVFPVYFHTGVITNLSNSPTEWRYVVTQWGKADPKYVMQYAGGTKWQLKINNVRKFYGVPTNENILKLAFVFRNGDGSLVGRAADGSDMFIPLSPEGFNVSILLPSQEPLFLNIGDSLEIFAISQLSKSLSLYLNDSLIATTNSDTIQTRIGINHYGKKRIIAVAIDSSGNKASDSTYFVVRNPNPTIEEIPSGIIDGINYSNDSTVTLMLFAPWKKFVYVIGDFNNWEVDPAYEMKQSPDGKRWWLTIKGLTPGKQYAFQYLVDDSIRIADPYADLVLDPWNDNFIDSLTYPHLKKYPYGKTTEYVSVLQTAQSPFQWTDGNYQKPPKEKLVIYELLLRDFIKTHNYQSLRDTLNYFKKLGINAIELMPIMEFDGNLSWGYNPAFLFAPDKYYGTKNALKDFINECHKKNIAVILDIVLNHTFGQSPFVRLYALGRYGPPSKNNPWLNPDMNPAESGYQGPHPFGVGYDFNHESPYTQALVKRVNRYWIKEFHVDGYRYDLSKGFTQKLTLNDVGAWGQYDQSRINILKQMADSLWAFDSTAYIILEHFAENSEEKVLSNYGMMLWGNLNHDYLEASMGYSSNLTYAYYKNRGWSKPNLVTYMESHDEERMMYKNLKWGNSKGTYNIQDFQTALNRVKLAAAFFFTIPGPKMIWQFEELAYDYSINYNGRTGEKPIRWDYYLDASRKKLFKTFAALIGLRKFSTFNSKNISTSLSGYAKRIKLEDSLMAVTIVGDFHVTQQSIAPQFQRSGMWYDFFSGDSFYVLNKDTTIILEPGEFHIFTTKKLPSPGKDLLTAVKLNSNSKSKFTFRLEQNFPNPFNPTTSISYYLPKTSMVVLKVYNVLGKLVRTIVNKEQKAGVHNVKFNASNLASGIYFYSITAGEFHSTKKMLLIK